MPSTSYVASYVTNLHEAHDSQGNKDTCFRCSFNNFVYIYGKLSMLVKTNLLKHIVQTESTCPHHLATAV